MTAAIEDQDVRAVLVCHPDPSKPGSAEFTFWANLDEARQAEAELCHPRCGPHCIGSYTAVRVSAQLEPRRRPTTPRTRT